MDMLWNAFHIAFFTLLFRHTGMLGGWNYDQILVFAGALFVSDAINMTVFSNNLWWLPVYVNKGDLDYYLVRPVSSLFFLSLRDFAANSFLNLLIAIGILAWALARYPGPLPFERLAPFLVFLVLGAVLQYVIHMVFVIPVFWLHSPTGLKETYYAVSATSNKPHRIYTGWVRRVLVSILPFTFVVSYPVRFFLEGATPLLLLHGAAVVAGSFLVMVAFWRLALKNYASASS